MTKKGLAKKDAAKKKDKAAKSAVAADLKSAATTAAPPAAAAESSTAAISRALGDPRRFELLRRIAQDDAATCTDLSACLKMNTATLSHHMKQLEAAGLIETRRDGKYVRATLRRKVWKNYVAQLKELAA